MIIAFDFDMTLVDSSKGILSTIHQAFEEHSIQMVEDPIERFNTLRGQKLHSQLQGMTAERLKASRLSDVERTFRNLYPETGLAGTRLLPSVLDMLHLLASRGVEVHVVSAKGQENLNLSMAKLGISPNASIGGVSGSEKSSYLRAVGCTTYIGDMECDVVIARETPCQSIIINNANEDLFLWTSQPNLAFAGTENFFEWLKIPGNLESL